MSNEYKKQAAVAAMEWVKPGMKLGLGTGSTAAEFVRCVGVAVQGGLDVLCVPTSESTRVLAQELGIALTTLDETPHLDLTVDGADEINPQLALIKGGGGAHLREKLVALASDDLLVIADESKVVNTLGAFHLPLEVIPFGLGATRRSIEAVLHDEGLSGALDIRMQDKKPLVTDNGNIILDAKLGANIADPRSLALKLDHVTGLVEHGLFVDVASAAIVTGKQGVRTLRR